MTLSPADRTRLRTTRGEFMEGVEVVTITRADLDELLEGPRTVTTVEELDALPDMSVIITEQGGLWEAVRAYPGRNVWQEPGREGLVASETLALPATVLHEGDPR